MNEVEKHLLAELNDDLTRVQNAIAEIIIEEIPRLNAAGFSEDELEDAIKEIWIGGLSEWAYKFPERLPANFPEDQRSILSRLARETLPPLTKQINILVTGAFRRLEKGGAQ